MRAHVLPKLQKSRPHIILKETNNCTLLRSMGPSYDWLSPGPEKGKHTTGSGHNKITFLRDLSRAVSSKL